MSTNPQRSGISLTRPEIAHLVMTVGNASPEQAITAVAIAWAESGGRTNAYRPEQLNPLGGSDHGLFQVNDKAHRYSLDVLYNPYGNVNAARQISKQWTDWGPWAYGPNSYRETSRTDLDLAGATAAVQTPVDPSARINAIPGIEAVAPSISGQPAGDLPWWARIGEAANRPGGAGLGTTDAISDGRIGDAIRAGIDATPLAVLAQFLGTLSDPLWWRRIGVGALGVGLVVLALVLVGRSSLPGVQVGSGA